MYAPNKHSSTLACSSFDNPTNGARTLLLDRIFLPARLETSIQQSGSQMRRCEDTRTACQGSHGPVSKMLNRRKKNRRQEGRKGDYAFPRNPRGGYLVARHSGRLLLHGG